MNLQWSSHLKGDAKDDFNKLVRNSTTLLDRLTKIIDQKIEALEKQRLELEGYSKPNWAYLQADITGSIRELKILRAFTHIER